MAFGFNDFTKFFDPVSDLLGTSGKQGVGLLQQKPEDIAMAAAAAYLMANGIPISPEALAAAEPLAAAGPSAALATPEVAALTPEASGIMEVAQMNPEYLNSINGPGMQTADAGGSFLDRFYTKGVDLNPPDYRALNTEQLFTQDAAKASLNNVPPGLEAEINSQYHGQNLGGDMGPGIKDAALNANTAQYPLSPSSNLGPGGPYPGERFVPGGDLGPGGPYPGEPYVPGGQLGPTAEEYRNLAENTTRYPSGGPTGPSPEMEEFHRALNERSAAAPPSNVQQFDNPASTTQNVFRGNPAEAGFQPPQVTKGGYFNNGIDGGYTDTLDPFQRGMETAGKYFDKAAAFAKEYPYPTAALAYYGAYKTGMLDQPKQEPIADNYKNPYNMGNFRRSNPNPGNYQYAPRYAEGGIASVQGYKRGGRSKTEAAMDFYDAMNPQQESAPPSHGSPGIYYDTDPDTRYLDPMEAAMVRMSKLNSRTNVQAPTMTPNRRMGELDFKPVAAAQGGIMGYAGGGDIPTYYEELYKLNGRGGGGRTKEDPGEKFNLQNTAIYSSDNPLMSLPGRYFTSPASYLGVALNLINPEGTKAANAAFNGINPEAVARQEAQPARQAENIRGLEAAYGPGSGGDAPPGPSDSEQAANRADVGQSGLAQGGGIMGYNLGGYAAGGNPRLLRGPGDGMSDHIPATINNRQPARLADGEYVITADVVSHLGNGSTEAGARQLDAMMKRIRKGRTGTPKQGKQINPRKYLPA